MTEFPVALPPQGFVELLTPLASRSYSIASSQRTHPEELFLLISRVSYMSYGRERLGAASGQLCDRVQPGDTLPVWIEPNPSFRLPKDPNVPIILIGAGTGIAPFRAFIEERAALAAPGKSWVLFGNRSYRADFTYQTQWQKWHKDGVLTRMNVAFSRDRPEKHYVTDLLREHGRDLYDWLSSGAALYLCGDKAKLSEGVDRALLDVLVTHGGDSRSRAEECLTELRQQRRYLKDVY